MKTKNTENSGKEKKPILTKAFLVRFAIIFNLIFFYILMYFDGTGEITWITVLLPILALVTILLIIFAKKSKKKYNASNTRKYKES